MNKTDGKVAVILSHNQELNGKPQKAGAEVSVEPRLARALVARGSAQLPKTKTAAKAAGKVSK